MNIQKISWWVSTLGPVGYFGASGTVATLFTLPVVYALHKCIANQWIYFSVLCGLSGLTVILVNNALAYLNYKHDPSEIVLDEFVGTLLTFWGIALSTKSVLVGFLLFRALDIIKIGPIGYAESWNGASGVVGDDIVAAALANIILRFLF